MALGGVLFFEPVKFSPWLFMVGVRRFFATHLNQKTSSKLVHLPKIGLNMEI